MTTSHRNLFILLLFLLPLSSSSLEATSAAGTIIFTTLGRSRYNFDIFSLPIATSSSTLPPDNDRQLTDGVSVNFNGFFPSLSSSSFLPSSSSSSSSSLDSLLYVTERNGSSAIYLDLFPSVSASASPSVRRTALQLPTRLQFPLLPTAESPRGAPLISMMDRPSLSGDLLVYVSTHHPSSSPRQSWAAVYSTHIPTGSTRRLTPSGVADFSPAVSPSGAWIAVASYGDEGWSGDVEELRTSIYLLRTEDGSRRSLLVDHGSWPCWADDSTLYFHRRGSDGWWSIYRATISFASTVVSVESVVRITPPGFHAFTPATSAGAPGIIAVATRRQTSKFRHIELIDMRNGSNVYVEVTRPVAPYSHHYNPFISPDGSKVAYHRCRGSSNGDPSLLLENIKSVAPENFSLLRFDGSFPSFSPDGKQIAYVNLPGLFVVNSDGSSKPREVFSGNAFPTAWDWKRKGVIYTSTGPEFAGESTRVDIISITLPDDDGDEDAQAQPSIKQLTTGGENNAFPSPSPDGKWVVFRSGRSGYKNLYIMDAEEGESAGIHQLTEGSWTDTMCSWSPDGEWIAFASDRDDPGSGGFSIYIVHPNGTGLRRVVHSGSSGGRTNHPCFSPDSKSLVFTSDYAGISAEPISNPHHYQPYGEIFTIKIDGSDILRLTHNSFEDGTPTWTPFFLEPADVAEALDGSARCSFDDCHWLNINKSPT
ncbi:tol-Pal system protein TolB-like [Zingiber officinale]|uniref:Uncharacterized protein n=1 Tax=Zingiber officinale TaxID=94328 RepID=A0A8J5LGA7_ZINOF|nr:tol-Pal system protein TolB-like [Zingiber officinale]KAG6526093.1 hypothetical protein ZIOFF_016070 [Zingiber officinale]